MGLVKTLIYMSIRDTKGENTLSVSVDGTYKSLKRYPLYLRYQSSTVSFKLEIPTEFYDLQYCSDMNELYLHIRDTCFRNHYQRRNLKRRNQSLKQKKYPKFKSTTHQVRTIK